MAKDFAKGFYSTKAWQKCRSAYLKSVGGLCEICLASGIYKAGVIVHHKIQITPDNIQNPDILLNPENLQLVCRECHDRIHELHKRHRRYEISANGRVTSPPGR